MAESDTNQRRPGELTFTELLRWTWRQVTSMRTALVLLLLLALAAVPGSVVPQEGVDSLAVTRWKEQHPNLTEIYERLGLFDVYSAPWFSAIYLLLVISLVGCIVPRTAVYWRALRAQPPVAPKNLSRLPASTSYTTEAAEDDVLEHARAVLGKRHRLRRQASVADTPRPLRGDTPPPSGSGYSTSLGAGESTSSGLDYVSAERGYLREAGNLLFHLSVLVVLAGFAMGALWGYQGGVILIEKSTFANSLTQYDDFDPGSLFTPEQLDHFAFTVDDFGVEWLTSGPRAGQAQGFEADLSYYADDPANRDEYKLRVNHPLTIGDTDVFLIGHGYAPVITVRDGEGNVAWSAPTIFLPQDPSFLSFGVVKATAAEPQAIGLEGLFYPSFAMVEGDPTTVFPAAGNPVISMLVYTGDLGLDDGSPQSVYVLDKDDATQLTEPDGSPLRIDLAVGDTYELPDGLGTVEFEGVQPWIRVQVSQTPGKEIALLGVVLALIGLLGSLFIRPRRVFVRTQASDDGASTLVEVAVLDRSGNADADEVLADVVAALQEEKS